MHPPAKVRSSAPADSAKSSPRVMTIPVPGTPVSPPSQAGAQQGETPADAALLRGKLLYGQGMFREAWHEWSPVAQFADPSTKAVHAETAWQFLFESYFKQGDRDNTPHFLQEIGGIEPTAGQSAIFKALLEQQTRERLQQLLQLQPAGSALAPIFLAALNPTAAATGAGLAATAPGVPTLEGVQPAPPSAASAAWPAAAAPTGPPLKVGLLLPLSGKWTGMGEHLRRAAKKALADYPSVPIQLLIADSGDSAATSLVAINELVAQTVDVVIGPVFYATVQPAVEVAAAHHIPIITFNPQRDTDTPVPGAYSNAFQPEQESKIMARYAVLEKRYHRIAILAPESEYGRGVAKTFSDAVQAAGGTIVRVTHFPPDTTDFSSWLKALGTQFDALFIPAAAKQVRLIAPQAAFFRVGSSDVALLGTSLWNSPELLTEGTDYLNGAMFCDIDPAVKEQFRQSFRQAWEEDPTTLATLAYDGVAVIAQLMQLQQQGGGNWRDALTRTAGFQGASGPVRFLEKGQSRRMYHLFQVGNGKIQIAQPVQDALNIP
ncbi:MAG: penicillin-binding protein activator [Magnetococcales bacterium]|nr:penicillin-binding protein activator [Magnetococcales bacterium]